MECSIINPALSLFMKHLVIGQHQKAPNFSAFHWSPRGSLVSIGQHFVTTRVVQLPKRTETSLIAESVRKDLITESDQAVRVLHSCNSWFLSVLRKDPVSDQFQFFSAFHWSPSIGKPLKTPARLTTCTCLGKTYLGPCVSIVTVYPFVCVLSLLVLRLGVGFDLLVPDHCLSFYIVERLLC